MMLHRLLTTSDKYAKGDELYNFERHQWMPVQKEILGMYYDPSSTTPARRKVNIPADKVKDVNPDEQEPEAWGFRKMEHPCRILVVQQQGIVDLEFNPQNLSPSKDHICFHLGDNGHVWMRTDDLEKLTREIITGEELPRGS